MDLPRDIVHKTFQFECPERVARSFEPSDFVGASSVLPNPKGDWVKIDDREWQRKDEWGNLWARRDESSKGQVIRGALENLEDVDTISLPDFSNTEFYANAAQLFSTYPHHWHIGYLHGFEFSMARKLRKLEQYLMDILLSPDEIHRLHDRIDKLIMEQMRQFKNAGADSVMFFEDWGTQHQMFINPELWCLEFKPRFVALCTYAHSLGMTVFMHSCGKITAIIPHLIESGIDVFQFDQPRIHGLEILQEFQKKNKITFWCPVDIQYTLPTRNPDFIQKEARELLDILWQGKGGFIAGYYGDNTSLGLEPEWQNIASRIFLKQGVKENYLLG